VKGFSGLSGAQLFRGLREVVLVFSTAFVATGFTLLDIDIAAHRFFRVDRFLPAGTWSGICLASAALFTLYPLLRRVWRRKR
jgi:hypothetical protein